MITALAGLLAVAALGCDQSGGARSSTATRKATDPNKPLNVVATTAMVADIVRLVGGERVVVRALMGAGVDPHLYRPTRDDVSMLLAADLVVYNGLNLDGKLSDTFVKVATAGRPVLAVTETLDEHWLLSPPDFEGHDDPHLWMDPNGWIKATEPVVSKLCELDPGHSKTFRRNADAFLAELRGLDAYARDRLATIPAERRVLVTAHDAFNYFARAYDLEVRGIQGISTESEAGLAGIESLVQLLVSRKIAAVFTESSVSDKNIRALVEGAKARGHEVKIGGELFSDAMGPDGTYEGTYVGMIDHNITTVVRALGGEAPLRGMNGTLKEH
jgi:manganese/zinc/iron transport system substrate-binding protein